MQIIFLNILINYFNNVLEIYKSPLNLKKGISCLTIKYLEVKSSEEITFEIKSSEKMCCEIKYL